VALTREGSQELFENAPSSPQTTAINTGTRTNGLLTVTVYGSASNVVSAMTATYAGIAMNADDNYEDPASANRHIWTFSLEGPSDDSDNLVLTWTVDSGGTMYHLYWMADWWDGGNQTAAFDSRTQGNGVTDPSINHTPGALATEFQVDLTLFRPQRHNRPLTSLAQTTHGSWSLPHTKRRRGWRGQHQRDTLKGLFMAH
jgi:hypothetical protein